ncbi:Protein held out wings [Papilio machaon]|uniref:Protein held out wings n=1 Tax=Papilio machaon TaxID=76193 RepID=A0A194RPX7_PAPMA|nr:Protein held out wings [Papilio machaon]
MCDNNSPSTQSIADYLAQLLKDRKQLAAFPNVFMHMERLLDEGTVVIDRFQSYEICTQLDAAQPCFMTGRNQAASDMHVPTPYRRYRTPNAD